MMAKESLLFRIKKEMCDAKSEVVCDTLDFVRINRLQMKIESLHCHDSKYLNSIALLSNC
jgi:hypothetical protein